MLSIAAVWVFLAADWTRGTTRIAVDQPVRSAAAKTGKERLGEKASDEQRVNDCHVPVEKRGSKKRPVECASH